MMTGIRLNKDTNEASEDRAHSLRWSKYLPRRQRRQHILPTPTAQGNLRSWPRRARQLEPPEPSGRPDNLGLSIASPSVFRLPLLSPASFLHLALPTSSTVTTDELAQLTTRQYSTSRYLGDAGRRRPCTLQHGRYAAVYTCLIPLTAHATAQGGGVRRLQKKHGFQDAEDGMCDNCLARGLQCVFELAGDIRPSLAEKIAINRRNALLGASHPAVRMAREMALAPRGANTRRHLQQHHMAFKGSRDGVTDVPRSSCQNAPSTVMFDPVRPAIQDRGEAKKDVDAGVLDGASSGHTGRGNECNTKGQCLMR
ncbi:hypothetical protein Purlil1_420 [Purpureocillium lilacinum]|uniref:Zn(2)-C6 fungal-type domain-containing protein n=1 Tax=Purpureocillium lilacinum TaxID=33203 RepID=A0ABR0CGS6_PURLI|nr:hypothetical protein Purlil1_420 [Purpureocillium lilacinum]